MLNQFEITFIDPAGNITALVKGIPDKNQRSFINNKIMELFPEVEQVGFYIALTQQNKAILEMAGGEFCGNATRSVAYLLLEGKKGEIQCISSGTNKILQAGIKEENTAYEEMPIINNFSSIQQLDKDIYSVELEGITHLIVTDPQLNNPEEYKKLAKNILVQYDLLSKYLATGIMFLNGNKITPVVWVRDIQTLIYEGSCAGGATAVGLYLAQRENKSQFEAIFQQPAGNISVTVLKDTNEFKNAFIDGPIKIMDKKTISL